MTDRQHLHPDDHPQTPAVLGALFDPPGRQPESSWTLGGEAATLGERITGGDRLMINRRKFLVGGATTAGVVVASAGPALGHGAEPDDRLDDGTFIGTVKNVQAGEVRVATVNGDEVVVPFSGYPDGITPGVGELIAVSAGETALPLVATAAVSEGADPVPVDPGVTFELLDETIVTDGEGNRIAYTTEPAPAEAVQEKPRALAIVYRSWPAAR